MCKLIPDTRDNSNTDNYNTEENFFRAIVGTNKDFFSHYLAKLDLIATILNGPYDQQNKDMSRYTFNCCINFLLLFLSC